MFDGGNDVVDFHSRTGDPTQFKLVSRALCCGLIAIFTVLAALSGNVSAKASSGKITLPMTLEENRRQAAPQVKYISRRNGYALFLEPTEATLALYETWITSRAATPFLIRMQFAWSSPQPVIEDFNE